jgi:group I intron endonuclease
MIGIYKIVSPRDKIYIGQSWDIHQREIQHKCTARKGYVFSKLYNSIRKYGWENHKFEIICEFSNDIPQNVLDENEIFYWKQYIDQGFEMLNVREPGIGGKHSEESKEKLRRPRSEEDKLKMRGIPKTLEHKQKLSEALKGTKLPEEVKEKISKSLKGRIFSSEHRRKISEKSKGNKGCLGMKLWPNGRSEETRRKLSEKSKGNKNCVGRILSEETKEKIRQSRLGKFLSEETKEKIKRSKLIRKNEKNNNS